MATLRNRSGKFYVMIRKKGHPTLHRVFSNKEDAEIFAYWKEDILEQITNFEPPLEELITLDTAIEMKIQEATNQKLGKKTIKDIKDLKNYFANLLDQSLFSISYENLMCAYNELSKKEIRRGGSIIKGGIYKLPSQKTLRNRFAILSSVYSLMIKKGVKIVNHPLNILSFIKDKLYTEGHSKSIGEGKNK
jgi:hypothetical protein